MSNPPAAERQGAAGARPTLPAAAVETPWAPKVGDICRYVGPYGTVPDEPGEHRIVVAVDDASPIPYLKTKNLGTFTQNGAAACWYRYVRLATEEERALAGLPPSSQPPRTGDGDKALRERALAFLPAWLYDTTGALPNLLASFAASELARHAEALERVTGERDGLRIDVAGLLSALKECAKELGIDTTREGDEPGQVQVFHAIQDLKARAEKAERERDAWKADLDNELMGHHRLRTLYGAHNGETFMEFIARLAEGEKAALARATTLSRDLDGARAERDAVRRDAQAQLSRAQDAERQRDSARRDRDEWKDEFDRAARERDTTAAMLRRWIQPGARKDWNDLAMETGRVLASQPAAVAKGSASSRVSFDQPAAETGAAKPYVPVAGDVVTFDGSGWTPPEYVLVGPRYGLLGGREWDAWTLPLGGAAVLSTGSHPVPLRFVREGTDAERAAANILESRETGEAARPAAVGSTVHSSHAAHSRPEPQGVARPTRVRVTRVIPAWSGGNALPAGTELPVCDVEDHGRSVKVDLGGRRIWLRGVEWEPVPTPSAPERSEGRGDADAVDFPLLTANVVDAISAAVQDATGCGFGSRVDNNLRDALDELVRALLTAAPATTKEG